VSAVQRNEVFIYETKEQRLSLECFRHYYFIHQEVYRWTPSARRDTARILDILSGLHHLSVFVAPENKQLIRYSALFGFTYSHTLTSPLDGEDYLILERH